MKSTTRLFFTVVSTILLLGLFGCSRTINDIAKWKASGNIEKLIGALEEKAEPAVAPLAMLFSDQDSTVILSAVEALVAIGNEPAILNLSKALQLENTEARLIAATGLGTLKAASAVDPLIEALNDTEESVTVAAATSLGFIADEKSSASLAAQLKSPSAKLRLACAEALASTKGQAAVKGLVGALGDSNAGVRTAVITSLVSIGPPSIPSILDVLKDSNETVRRGALAVLKQADAIPTSGNNLIWYKLASVSVDAKPSLNMAVIDLLANMGNDAVEPLLEAATHRSAAIRNHAGRALEEIGESCAKEATTTATDFAGNDSLAWFNGRTTWSGAPSWRIDLWGAVAALNPDFSLDTAKTANMQAQGRNAFRVITAPDFQPIPEYIPLLITLLGDTTTPPEKQPDVDQYGMPVVKKSIDRFRGEANQQMAKDKLVESGAIAVFPLIASIGDNNTLIGGHAAEILGEIGDLRALEPLISSLKKKIANGEELSNSPYYSALQKLDDPAAEPVLLKVRPNTDRAIRIFERQYTGTRAMSAESRDLTGHYSQPISFRIGFIDDGKVGELNVTFVKDGFGDWKASPALPAELPQ
jgi:HEAT repeat protein